MKRILFSAVALAFAVLAGAPAYAQATRTWVSGLGDDSAACSRTAPCKTFAGAISKTLASGEIDCLDPGGFGSVTITKSITIDCTGVNGGILNAGTTGVIVNGSGITVTLRNMTLDGAGTGTVGISLVNGLIVNLEGVEVFGNTQQGVKDARTTAGAMLVIKNSIIRNNTLAGIVSAAASGSGVLLENVVSMQNQFGVAVASGVAGIVSRSNFSNNTTAGIQVDTGGLMHVNDSVLNMNGTGIFVSGTASVSNTSVVFNTNGFGGSGTINTFGNNRVIGNAAVGSALVAVGPASTDLGEK